MNAPDYRSPDAADRLGTDPAHRSVTAPGLIEIDGVTYYTVPEVDRMSPFLMSVVSDGDRWMFISSNGGVTAGRRDVAGALFPYETDDRLHHLAGVNGPVTAMRIVGDNGDAIWRPTTGRCGAHRVRTLYKSVVGDAVVFEERDEATGLTFRYRWSSSDRFGFMRTATLENDGNARATVELIDGLRNILPHGLDPSIYLPMGNLSNAYKRSELIDPDLRLAVYSLESLLTDRPEPAEALRATVVWSVGLEAATVSLDPEGVRAFEMGRGDGGGRSIVTGLPGAYFLTSTLDLEPGDSRTWHIVADASLDHRALAARRRELRSLGDPSTDLVASEREASRSLVEIMARADGLQCTGDEIATAHHFSNVTYNVMRGGVALDGYRVDVRAFTKYVALRNAPVAARHQKLLDTLDVGVERRELIRRIAETGDVDLVRLGHEYLPFSFSRRHGDPSRPWNTFSIRVTDSDGHPVTSYEGNWRDIFQNWEAMCVSFPEYLPDIVSVFVDASTPDGFNPYRITSDGIDWEVLDPDDPWSNIGYWGDHQIVYLLRLLELSERYLPGSIEELLGLARFTYADVPYRIVPYDRLVVDPKSTIEFDEEAARRTDERVRSVGADGKLVWRDRSIYHVTLVEKLLVPALGKLSNFVPGGGIWMNTQRPEWNDANNALVGNGLSMVTLYQLRRYIGHLWRLLNESDLTAVELSNEVATWLTAVTEVLRSAPLDVEPGSSDRVRKEVMDALGGAFSDYRLRYYRDGFSGTTPIPVADMVELCEVATRHMDATILASRRPDGLFHSYNMVRFTNGYGSASVEHLGEMLEGQVAVIESGVLDPDQCAGVVDALFASSMYRADQNSFMLYPARHLPSFLDKNVVQRSVIDGNPLLSALVAVTDESIIATDVDGRVRFTPAASTKEDLAIELNRLAAKDCWRDLVRDHRIATIRAYEETFGHQSYTGRSGSMYGYEGIGSIYWHMVAKLLVAVQDAVFRSVSSGASPEVVRRLVDGYWRVRSGMGSDKTPREHGAIPIDPYSHTPAHAGAQQPGMTGLVKEEILVRPAELGVLVERGEITFDPTFVRRRELLDHPQAWSTLNTSLEWVATDLHPGSFASTVCQVPIIVATAEEASVEVEFTDGTKSRWTGRSLGKETSSMIFARSGEVVRVHAHIPVRDE
ncbi:MAG TPA: hypothetical protein VLA29_03105 [Acidimicrobiia bacterium]|nr:hypothetical protein [Acidimicrobiia bacterium]